MVANQKALGLYNSYSFHVSAHTPGQQMGCWLVKSWQIAAILGNKFTICGHFGCKLFEANNYFSSSLTICKWLFFQQGGNVEGYCWFLQEENRTIYLDANSDQLLWERAY